MFFQTASFFLQSSSASSSELETQKQLLEAKSQQFQALSGRIDVLAGSMAGHGTRNDALDEKSKAAEGEPACHFFLMFFWYIPTHHSNRLSSNHPHRHAETGTPKSAICVVYVTGRRP